MENESETAMSDESPKQRKPEHLKVFKINVSLSPKAKTRYLMIPEGMRSKVISEMIERSEIQKYIKRLNSWGETETEPSEGTEL